jgi:hypothetical protein
MCGGKAVPIAIGTAGVRMAMKERTENQYHSQTLPTVTVSNRAGSQDNKSQA